MKSVCIFIVSFGLTLLLSACNNIRPDCTSQKEGTFLVLNENSTAITEITRIRGYQIEKDLSDGTFDTLKIEWLNDCTYVLDFLQKTDKFKVTVEIMRVKQDTAYLRGWVRGIDYKHLLRMKKISGRP